MKKKTLALMAALVLLLALLAACGGDSVPTPDPAPSVTRRRLHPPARQRAGSAACARGPLWDGGCPRGAGTRCGPAGRTRPRAFRTVGSRYRTGT